MAEYINRQAALDLLWKDGRITTSGIKAIPSANVAPVVHGRWVMDGKDHCHCSECKDGRNIRTQIGWAFCPNCGAKMDKEGKNEN